MNSNARADMYSVGATYFICSRVEARLKKEPGPRCWRDCARAPAPSPRKFNPKIPPGLARVVLRVWKNSRANGSRAPRSGSALGIVQFGCAEPGDAWLAVSAGVLDMISWALFSTPITWLAIGNPMDMLSLTWQHSPKWLAWIFGWFAVRFSTMPFAKAAGARRWARPSAAPRGRAGQDIHPDFFRLWFEPSFMSSSRPCHPGIFYGFGVYAYSSTAGQNIVGFSVKPWR